MNSTPINYAAKYDLEPGDGIILPLFQTGLSKHFAIYLGRNAFGQELIAQNHIGIGVHIIGAAEFFSCVKSISRIEKFDRNAHQQQQVIQRALALVGKPYDLITFNCEHFANAVRYGKEESTQVTTAVVGLLIAFGLLSLKKR